jgi:hypothetical protein
MKVVSDVIEVLSDLVELLSTVKFINALLVVIVVPTDRTEDLTTDAKYLVPAT